MAVLEICARERAEDCKELRSFDAPHTSRSLLFFFSASYWALEKQSVSVSGPSSRQSSYTTIIKDDSSPSSSRQS